MTEEELRLACLKLAQAKRDEETNAGINPYTNLLEYAEELMNWIRQRETK
jgi:hypothetical protein